ncbi:MULTISPECIES: creatininase family protein [Halomicrobium]|uniref:Creatininase n=2 Tax=Halomicrobium mukohataei TaxID=57705 RepID=C7NZ26_HALMD|nr:MULTISPECIES: creatininase family protein [Halomicrobium]ACV46712.1 Creatininase [Halomicrobium mukohataei DSM 12286]QCD65221.1 creatininase family protein [Halomicrobium mukohataei]QFR20027.1 creatininase family protein [Halomicrobium sp. ZPS1]
MHLSEATWTDAADLDTDLAILPVGSTEQHGPHGPLGTDVLTAEAVAEAGAEAYDGEVVVAPAIPVGVAEEHRHFAGTLWVGEDTFRDYVRETVASLASHGWDRVVVVNGHGGNVDALREVCGRVTRDGTAYAVPLTWFDAVDAPDMGHGGPVETSLLLSTAPELVRTDRLEASAANGADSWGAFEHGVNLAYDTEEFSENGTVGDPRDANRERGDALLDAASDALADVLASVRERDR